MCRNQPAQLLHLAGSDQSGGIGRGPGLDDGLLDTRPSALRQSLQFLYGFRSGVGDLIGPARSAGFQIQTNQDCWLASAGRQMNCYSSPGSTGVPGPAAAPVPPAGWAPAEA